ncbi:hypothetical protein DENSPDRAFT_912736 [Dentipellis sp. KUC8613]|nr:hypothetical protein DENSPDRAFT_912736 [Dentipellis sp. KUC8613]
MAPHVAAVSPERILALACTVVGVGPGGSTSMLARVAITDYRGTPVLECYVAPTMPVTDYRTSSTGIEPAHLHHSSAYKFDDVQQWVSSLIRDRVIVGYSLWHDLSVLGIPHPAVNTRDVALYQPFRNALRPLGQSAGSQSAGLQTLTWQLMRRRCQEGHLHPLENARAALDLYRSAAHDWERAIAEGHWPCALPPSSFSRCYI